MGVLLMHLLKPPFILCSVMLGLRLANPISALLLPPLGSAWLGEGEGTGCFLSACRSHLGWGSCF